MRKKAINPNLEELAKRSGAQPHQRTNARRVPDPDKVVSPLQAIRRFRVELLDPTHAMVELVMPGGFLYAQKVPIARLRMVRREMAKAMAKMDRAIAASEKC